jgi:hypothetical protein
MRILAANGAIFVVLTKDKYQRTMSSKDIMYLHLRNVDFSKGVDCNEDIRDVGVWTEILRLGSLT